MFRAHYFVCALALVFWSCVCITSSQPSSVTHRWGEKGEEDELIVTDHVEAKPAKILKMVNWYANTIYQYQPKNATNDPIITAIEVTDLPQKVDLGDMSFVEIIRGGLNQTSVSLKFTARRGRALYSEIKIFGRYNDKVVVERDEEQAEQMDPTEAV